MALDDPGRDAAAFMNSHRSGWDAAMGLRFLSATPDEVVAELELEPRHHQPFGIVHGGVYAGMIESVTSVGAALVALPRGQTAVGLENHTSFLRAARTGRVRARAVPLTRGRSTQVWEATVLDEQERVLATGRVRLMCLEAGREIAGAAAPDVAGWGAGGAANDR